MPKFWCGGRGLAVWVGVPRSGVWRPRPRRGLLRRLKNRSSCMPGCGSPEEHGQRARSSSRRRS